MKQEKEKKKKKRKEKEKEKRKEKEKEKKKKGKGKGNRYSIAILHAARNELHYSKDISKIIITCCKGPFRSDQPVSLFLPPPPKRVLD